MYEHLFELNRAPFELSPDPYFVVCTKKTKEAMASLYYATRQRKGFVVITGEVGTGKTLLVRCLLDSLRRQRAAFANVFNPRLSALDFLRYIAFDLGIKTVEPTKSSLLQALFAFLLAQAAKGLTTVLVVDEAQQLSSNVLEEIRLLANFETSRQKLIQIILAGQPELDKKLDSYELRQLKQRIAARCRLEPFSEEETRIYIEGRLKLSGATQVETIFPVETIEAIHRYSLGIPRLINSICDQSLMAAYAGRVRTVSADMVDDVASYFRLQPKPEFCQTEKHSQSTGSKLGCESVLRVTESTGQLAATLRR
jgi:general secretion pathway protein A